MAYRDIVIADNPKAYWRLNEPAGSLTVVDEMGFRNGVYSNGDYARIVQADHPLNWLRMSEPLDWLPGGWDTAGNGTPIYLSSLYSSSGTTQAQDGVIAGDNNDAILLNGTSGYLKIPGGSAYNVADLFSIEIWAKRVGTGNYVLASKWFTNGGRQEWELRWLNTNTLQMTVWDSAGTSNVVATATLSSTDTTNWHHIVFTKNGASSKFYIDAVLATIAGTNRTHGDGTGDVYVGAQNGTTGFFSGYLDEFAYYGIELSQAQITAHYNAAKNAPSAPSPGITIGQPGLIQDGTAPVFDGVSPGGYIRLGGRGQSIISNLPNFSIEAWAKTSLTTAAQEKAIYAETPMGEQGGVCSLWLNIRGSNGQAGVKFVYWDKAHGGSMDIILYDTPWNDGQPHHIVVTRAASLLSMYLNGVLVMTTPLTNAFGLANQYATIGSQADAHGTQVENWNGSIDEVAVYPYALSPEQIARHFQVGSGGIPPEQPFTDMERIFVSESPPKLWPENQDSNLGQIRKVVTDPMQGISDDIQAMFNEIFANYSNPWLNRHEQDYGIPADLPGLSLPQRQQRLLLRIRKGAFTRTNRQKVVEEILAGIQSLGDPTQITPDGISLTASGVTLYSEPIPLDVSLYYDIVENLGAYSYIVNISPVITPDTNALTRELNHFTPAGISWTLTRNYEYANRLLGMSGLVSYWRLGETSGTVAADSKGTNPGTYTGGFTLNQTGALTDPNKAVRLTRASSGYVAVPDSASLDVGDAFSIVLWVKLASVGPDMDLFYKGTGAPHIDLIGGGGTQIRFEKGDTASVASATVTALGTTNWHMIVWAKNGTDNRFYLDGTALSPTITNQTIVNTASPLWFGQRGGGTPEFLDGTIDEYALFNRALTAQEVSTLYNLRTL
jgi:hypothetical protein